MCNAWRTESKRYRPIYRFDCAGYRRKGDVEKIRAALIYSRISIESLSPINHRIVGWKNRKIRISSKQRSLEKVPSPNSNRPSPALVHPAKSVHDGPTIAARALVDVWKNLVRSRFDLIVPASLEKLRREFLPLFFSHSSMLFSRTFPTHGIKRRKTGENAFHADATMANRLFVRSTVTVHQESIMSDISKKKKNMISSRFEKIDGKKKA